MADLQPCGARLHSGLATAESVHPFGMLACERPAPVLIIIVKLKSGRFVVGAQPIDEGLASAFHPASNMSGTDTKSGPAIWMRETRTCTS